MIEKLSEIIRSLFEKTQRKELRWHETADERAFRVAFPAAIVRISYTDERFYFCVLSLEGKIIEEFNAPRGSYNSDAKVLEELYEIARRSALRSDDVLNSLASDIESGNVTSPPYDSDVPNRF